MRKYLGASMLAIIPDQIKFAGIFMREIIESNGKIFLKLLRLTHEYSKFMLIIRGSKSHFVPLHLAFDLHLTARRINNFLST
jgi:hypothetical protein